MSLTSYRAAPPREPVISVAKVREYRPRCKLYFEGTVPIPPTSNLLTESESGILLLNHQREQL